MKKHTCFIILIVSLFITACNNQSNDKEIVARVNDEYLYIKDIENIIPDNVSNEDSAYIVGSYIDTWIKTQLLLQNAKNNLSDEQMDFEKLIKEYHNSLIIHTYQQKLIKEKLNTNINQEEIETYYNINKEEFINFENLYKINYFIAPVNSFKKSTLQKLIKTENNEKSFEEFCLRHAIEYYYDNGFWFYIDNFINFFPEAVKGKIININNSRKFIEYEDSINYYAIYFKDFLPKNSYSPLNKEIANIKTILQHKKKVDFLKKIEEELYKEAEKKGKIEIY